MRPTSLLSLVLVLLLAFATTATAEVQKKTSTFYLNRGASCAEKSLLLTAGSGGGCGDRGLNEVFIQVEGQPFFEYISSTTGAGMPLRLDADRDLSGQIGIGPDGAGTGIVEVELTLTGVQPGQFTPTTIGTASMTDSALTNALSTRILPFSFDIPAGLHDVTFSELTIELVVHGTYVNHGFVRHDANSYFRVPTLVEVP